MSQRPASNAPIASAVLAVAAFAPACATYNDHVQAPIEAFQSGDFGAAEQLFESSVPGSPFLASAEAGMSAMVDGRFDAALDHLRIAEEAA
ncbi:MAG: hypothetical protein AAGA20_10470, partial [Planctomycetota bacterium]